MMTIRALGSLRNLDKRAGEMAQPLRALTALLEVLSSIPTNHMVAHNHLLPSSGVCLKAASVYSSYI